MTEVKTRAFASHDFLLTHFQILHHGHWRKHSEDNGRQPKGCRSRYCSVSSIDRNRIVVEVLEAHYFEVNRRSCHLSATSAAWKNPMIKIIHSTSSNLGRRKPG